MVGVGGVDDSLGQISLMRTTPHHWAFHLPLSHWDTYSSGHDAVWPLRWLQDSRDTCYKSILTCSALSASDSLWSPHFALLFHTKGSRIIPHGGQVSWYDESLLGPWLSAILKGTWDGKLQTLQWTLQCIIGILKVSLAGPDLLDFIDLRV